MPALKAARLIPSVVNVECPYCGYEVMEPNSGSFMWDVDAITAGMVFKCDNPACFQMFSIPAKVAAISLVELAERQ
jgi:hypothetical protein